MNIDIVQHGAMSPVIPETDMPEFDFATGPLDDVMTAIRFLFRVDDFENALCSGNAFLHL